MRLITKGTITRVPPFSLIPIPMSNNTSIHVLVSSPLAPSVRRRQAYQELTKLLPP